MCILVFGNSDNGVVPSVEEMNGFYRCFTKGNASKKEILLTFMECWHLRNDQIHGKSDATSGGSVQLKTTGIHCAWSCKREMYKRKDRKNICEGTIVLVFVSLDNTN